MNHYSALARCTYYNVEFNGCGPFEGASSTFCIHIVIAVPKLHQNVALSINCMHNVPPSYVYTVSNPFNMLGGS